MHQRRVQHGAQCPWHVRIAGCAWLQESGGHYSVPLGQRAVVQGHAGERRGTEGECCGVRDDTMRDEEPRLTPEEEESVSKAMAELEDPEGEYYTMEQIHASLIKRRMRANKVRF